MSEEEQKAVVGGMMFERRDARQAHRCWREKLTKWGHTLERLGKALVLQPTHPANDIRSLLTNYPTQEDLAEALERMQTLHKEIARLNEALKDFE